LKKYLIEENTILVCSSDFCHWGKSFDFTKTFKNSTDPIYRQIELLDGEALTLIEQGNLSGFHNYQNETGNTICGEYPIMILLALMQ
jgi:AmmeMemoRadiSam system protein B